MITSAYCRTMARYNAWQNHQLRAALAGLGEAAGPDDALETDRGAFWGSILGTLSHILWGDFVWMARFDGGDPPTAPITESASMVATLGAWQEARAAMDRRILDWSTSVAEADLRGDLVWYSQSAARQMTNPMALLVTHMFNHQTHHRGQIHAMLTAAGEKAPVSDLFLMPTEGEWL